MCPSSESPCAAGQAIRMAAAGDTWRRAAEREAVEPGSAALGADAALKVATIHSQLLFTATLFTALVAAAALEAHRDRR